MSERAFPKSRGLARERHRLSIFLLYLLVAYVALLIIMRLFAQRMIFLSLRPDPMPDESVRNCWWEALHSLPIVSMDTVVSDQANQSGIGTLTFSS